MLLIKIIRPQFRDKKSWSFRKLSWQCEEISKKKDIKIKNQDKKDK